ncbi:transposase [Streptomyces sp. H27-H5]|uniref:transposase n=1 Tax=Streptomyces sp. H27-H5 TaxID=2996460 RepID=UPI003B6340B3
MKNYPPEFRADAVALYESRPGATIRQIAADLGINPETLRNWIRAAGASRPRGHRAQVSAESATPIEAENAALRQKTGAVAGPRGRRTAMQGRRTDRGRHHRMTGRRPARSPLPRRRWHGYRPNHVAFGRVVEGGSHHQSRSRRPPSGKPTKTITIPGARSLY